ncbi:MAG: ankyrin repeat domain-containing protein [Chitinophagaceae bacterium]
MNYNDIKDPLFLSAVNAVDEGNLLLLKQLVSTNPRLVTERLHYPEGHYFKDPYLLWFVADNPIRIPQLPANIVAITKMLTDAAQQYSPSNFQEQIGYALGLVTTGRIPRECGVQIALMDVLIDAGAIAGKGHGALAHGNLEAAAHLVKRGGPLTLATAICLDKTNEATLLIKESTKDDRETALVAAAFYGKANAIKWLLEYDVDINAYPKEESGFHWHATALHQAVYSGSIEIVSLLVNAGADLQLRDRIYNGTPLGWAEYAQTEDGCSIEQKEKYAAIAELLRNAAQKKNE